MFIDSHNHQVNWSRDAVQTCDELIASAKANGLYGVGISDHYDIGSFTSTGLEWIFDIDDYLETVVPRKRSFARAKASGEQSFHVGIELGYLPQHRERLRKIMAYGEFDYFLLSMHFVYGQSPPRDAASFFARPLHDAYVENFKATIEALDDFSDVQVLSHFDYASRYAPERESKMYYREFSDYFDELFRTLIRHNIALEINTGTIDYLGHKGYKGEDAFPDPDIIRRYLDLGGELLTISSDTHNAKHHTRPTKSVVDFLKHCGVDKLAYFENKNALTHSI